MNIKLNEIELKGITSFNDIAQTSLDHARNLGYYLGCSTWKNNAFQTQLDKLVKAGVITKLFHTYENEYIEAVYNFKDGNQISFFGHNHMTTKLYYCY